MLRRLLPALATRAVRPQRASHSAPICVACARCHFPSRWHAWAPSWAQQVFVHLGTAAVAGPRKPGSAAPVPGSRVGPTSAAAAGECEGASAASVLQPRLAFCRGNRGGGRRGSHWRRCGVHRSALRLAGVCRKHSMPNPSVRRIAAQPRQAHPIHAPRATEEYREHQRAR